MKKICLIVLSALAFAVAFAQTADKPSLIPLAEARSKIGEIVGAKSGDAMAAVIRQLSPADQKQFLADVNKAIGELPASKEEKAAKYLNVNKAAVKAAAKGNIKVLIAEVFATVPPDALTVINEQFAVTLFNREATAGGEVISDARYAEIAMEVIQAVNERVAEMDNASVRSTFAILMLVRAADEKSAAELTEKLIATLPNKEAQELARTEWIPTALKQDGREMGYDPLLASADAGARPDLAFVLTISGPQFLESVLQDLAGKNVDDKALTRSRTPVLDAVQNPLDKQIPTLGGDIGGGGGGGAVTAPPAGEPRPTPGQPEPTPPEPGPY